MSIQDSKKRERIYTHHKTIQNKELLLGKLPGWNMLKFDKILESLKQKEVIEISGIEIKIFSMPFKEKTSKANKNEEFDNSHLTQDETELLVMLSDQSISC